MVNYFDVILKNILLVRSLTILDSYADPPTCPPYLVSCLPGNT